ncbi:hypothetical protein BaRGS_00037904 [Batillaria attramentaria]|uniref:Uncharacterized protein n=1 Tax=Batillaria attramentaria TaxID=370345 RepID=A0ABD0J7M1_9CAEN
MSVVFQHTPFSRTPAVIRVALKQVPLYQQVNSSPLTLIESDQSKTKKAAFILPLTVNCALPETPQFFNSAHTQKNPHFIKEHPASDRRSRTGTCE